jgi:hypothetical protein
MTIRIRRRKKRERCRWLGMAVIAAGDGPGESSAQFNGFFLRPLFSLIPPVATAVT